MLYLLFQLGADRYGIEAAVAREILPCLRIKAIPCSPRGLAGLLDYHGEHVPVVDLNELATGSPSPALASTRIVIAVVADETPAEYNPIASRLVGLLVPRATEIFRADESSFVAPPLRQDGAPYLGKVASHPSGLIQLVRVADLLTEEMRETLMLTTEAA